MNRISELIRFFTANPCVSGKSTALSKDSLCKISPIFQNCKIDPLGNIIVEIKSKNQKAKNLIIESHRDVIGLCIKEITKDGFLLACTCGGFDRSILPGTQFSVFGKESFCAIATSIPPHLARKADKASESTKKAALYLDAGFHSKKEAEKFVSVGDVAFFKAEFTALTSDEISSAGLDNAASMVAIILAAEALFGAELDTNLYFCFTVGEETSSNGIRSICEEIQADAALVVDVGFALTPGNDPASCILMHHGPSVSYTDTLSRDMTLWVKSGAESADFDLQLICEAGGTGTSATALNVQNGGIPSAVISIPLKNMHTPSEIVSMGDIEKTSKLIQILAKKADLP